MQILPHYRVRGFTHVELLAVVAILAVVAALVLPRLSVGRDEAKLVATKQLIDALRGPMNEYKSLMSRYPPSRADWSTENIVSELGTDGLMLFEFDDNQIYDPDGTGAAKPVLIDSWGTPFRYTAWFGRPDSEKAAAVPAPKNKNLYDLWSAGPDRSFDEADGGPLDVDNVTNWSTELSGDALDESSPAEPRGQRAAESPDLTLTFALAVADSAPADAQVHMLKRAAERELRLSDDGRPLASLEPRLLPGARLLEVNLRANTQRGLVPLTKEELVAQARVVLDAWIADLMSTERALRASANAERERLSAKLVQAEKRVLNAMAELSAIISALGDGPNETSRVRLEAERVRQTAEHMVASAARDELATLVARHDATVLSLQPVLVDSADAAKLGAWPGK